MLLKCIGCGDNFQGYHTGVHLCNRCSGNGQNNSNANYGGTSGGSFPNQPFNQSVYKSGGDMIINAKDNKVAQIKKFINTSIDDINKWLIENNVKEVTSFVSEEKKEFQQWAGGGCGRNWTETTIIYKIEV